MHLKPALYTTTLQSHPKVKQEEERDEGRREEEGEGEKHLIIQL